MATLWLSTWWRPACRGQWGSLAGGAGGRWRPGEGARIQGLRLPGEDLGAGGRKPVPYRGGGNPEGSQIRGRGRGEPLGARVPREGAGNWVGQGQGPGSSLVHTGRSQATSDFHGEMEGCRSLVGRSCSWWAVTAAPFSGRRKASATFGPSLLDFGETSWCILEPLKPVAWDLQDPRTQGHWLCSGDAAQTCHCLLAPARAGEGGAAPPAPGH